MRKPLHIAFLTGVTLFVAACGGGAANNGAPAVDNGTTITNDPMAPDLNAGMPADNGASMNSTTITTTAPGGNTTTTTTTTNTTNGM